MEPLTVVAHDGTFHTDDVFACATLSLAFKDRELEIVRSRDQAVIDGADIVVDVGGVYDTATLRFDHHQKGGAGARDNSIPYASFGLVWKEYGVQLAGNEESAKFIDEQLVQGIDGADNGVLNKVADNGVYCYSVIDIISAMRTTWEEHSTMDEAFMEAVNVAVTILERMLAHAASYTHAQAILETAYTVAPDKQIIEIGKEYPGWYEVMTNHPEPLFVIYQREDGAWSAKAVRVTPIEFAARKQFPEAWAGLRDEELQAVSGVSDAIFCHNGRFIAVAQSREGAYKLAQKAIIL
ncbi:MAG: metal-dependent protein hydrolase [Candidatus Nomurabacteria bacterium]|nr:metal-dependent protein hydrolase [Candidatus Nomurabacteria bacterium]